MADKVVFASEDVTLHSVQGEEQFNGNTVYNVESVNLSVGDYFNYDKLPPYQKDAIDAGKVPGVEVLSADEAEDKRAKRVEFLKSIGVGAPDINFQTVGFSGPDADDGSHSDHEVSDEERAANHAARAEKEAGESGGSKKKSADSEESGKSTSKNEK